jgi:hypothetical protein
MGILALDDAVEVAQPVAHGSGGVGIAQVVDDRLVVFVDEHDDALACRLVDAADHLSETTGGAGEVGLDSEALFILGQQLADALIEQRALVDHAAAEAEPDNRMAHRPVPALMRLQTTEQWLVAGEQLGEGVKEQRLAEAAGRERK